MRSVFRVMVFTFHHVGRLWVPFSGLPFLSFLIQEKNTTQNIFMQKGEHGSSEYPAVNPNVDKRAVLLPSTTR